MQKYDNTQYNLYNSLPCGVVVFRSEPPFDVLYANDIYCNNYSGSNADILNIYEADYDKFCDTLKLLSDSQAQTLNCRIASSEDDLHSVQMVISAENSSDAFVAVLTDYSAHQNLEHELTRYSIAIGSSHNIVFEYDIAADICQFFIPDAQGGTQETHEFNGFKKFIDSNSMVHSEDIKKIFAANGSVFFDGAQLRIKLSDNDTWLWHQIHCSYVKDANDNYTKIIGTLHNIENVKKEEAQLKNQIEIDPLSKVYTRTAAIEKINTILLETAVSEYAFVMIDLDNFKAINDTYGHLYGDAVISMVAGCIKSNVKDSDILGRFGGDEFFALISGESADDIAQTADKITKAVYDLCKNLDNASTFSCSMGIALKSDFPANVTFEALFKAADRALYHAKNNGKNQFAFYDADFAYEENASESAYARIYTDDSESSSSSSITAMALEILTKSKSTDNALATLLRHIGVQLNLDFLQIMNIDCTSDMVTLDHEWNKDSNVVNISNRKGYYIHSDIEELQYRFSKKNFFVLNEDTIKGFSEKLTNEFRKLIDKKAIYSASVNDVNSFYMIVYQRFNAELDWTEEELNTISEITKIINVYIGNHRAPSAREKHLQELLDYDTFTGVCSLRKFFDLSGLMRKRASESNYRVFVAHCDFNDFTNFNNIYDYATGNEIMLMFANVLSETFSDNRYVIARYEETERFLIMTYAADEKQFMADITRICNEFTSKHNARFEKHPLILKAFITELKNKEWVLRCVDRIRAYRKTLHNLTENHISYIE